ncbi:hypothetical protein AKJ16_DCAP10094 [Drosera capensis]
MVKGEFLTTSKSMFLHHLLQGFRVVIAPSPSQRSDGGSSIHGGESHRFCLSGPGIASSPTARSRRAIHGIMSSSEDMNVEN